MVFTTVIHNKKKFSTGLPQQTVVLSMITVYNRKIIQIKN